MANRQPWQKHPLTQLAAVLFGIVPIYVLVTWSSFASQPAGGFAMPDLVDTVFNLVLLVGGFGGLLILLLYLLCGEKLADLDLKPGAILTDIIDGGWLALLLIVSQMVFLLLMSSYVEVDTPAANAAIAHELAADPLLKLVWLGPVVWLQAGLFEEFTRVFMLSRLWQVWPGRGERFLVLIGSALLFGLGHLYQGPLGVAGTALIGLILGWHYLARGRVLPLIVGHALYDTAVLSIMISAAESGLL